MGVVKFANFVQAAGPKSTAAARDKGAVSSKPPSRVKVKVRGETISMRNYARRRPSGRPRRCGGESRERKGKGERRDMRETRGRIDRCTHRSNVPRSMKEGRRWIDCVVEVETWKTRRAG